MTQRRRRRRRPDLDALAVGPAALTVDEARDLQRAARLAGQPVLLMAQHPLGATAPWGRPTRATRGLRRERRGGAVDLLGPGQLRVYVVGDLEACGWYHLRSLTRRLERGVLRTLGEYGVRGLTLPGVSGVWVGPRLLATVGVGLCGRWTQFGLSLGLSPPSPQPDQGAWAPSSGAEPTPSSLVGAGPARTTLEEEAGPVDLLDVAEGLVIHLGHHLRLRPRSLDMAGFRDHLASMGRGTGDASRSVDPSPSKPAALPAATSAGVAGRPPTHTP